MSVRSMAGPCGTHCKEDVTALLCFRALLFHSFVRLCMGVVNASTCFCQCRHMIPKSFNN
jgi:hypothetical protein